jgi:hypothetical protein
MSQIADGLKIRQKLSQPEPSKIGLGVSGKCGVLIK